MDGGLGGPNSAIRTYAGFGDVSTFVESLPISEILDSPAGRLIGHGANALGPVISGAQLYDYTANNGNGAQGSQFSSYLGKFAVDSSFAGLAAWGAVTANPIGVLGAGLYGVSDFGLSFLPDYKAEYGPFKGEVIKGGWHNLHQREVDRTVEQLNRGEDPFKPISPYYW